MITIRQNKPWSRLDNAAKIFPPTSSKRDTKVFRYVCELTEPVNGQLLQHALEKTVEEFPLYRSVLKKGLFWYYFEESNLPLQVMEENLPVCSPIYNEDKPGLLFRVSYYKNRINFELFHALADGSGALQFLRSMVFGYLTERYTLSGHLADYDASQDQKCLDAFYKYYDYHEDTPKEKRYRAYRIRGERLPDNRLGIIELFFSVKLLQEKIHTHSATISEFLISLLLCSIHDGMPVREHNRPVIITVPVDLRRFFSAKTARNFFGVIQITHNFKKDGKNFDQVISHVQEQFQRKLSSKYLHGLVNQYSAIESNLLVKIIPLQIKILFLRLAGLWADGEDTAAFSNIGRVSMPREASKYIRLFDVFLSTKRPQLCLCSFGDTMSISISSPLKDTGLQRHFIRKLTGMGIPVQVVSNLEQTIGEGASHVSV